MRFVKAGTREDSKTHSKPQAHRAIAGLDENHVDFVRQISVRPAPTGKHTGQVELLSKVTDITRSSRMPAQCQDVAQNRPGRDYDSDYFGCHRVIVC
jgi:hypothetical protein